MLLCSFVSRQLFRFCWFSGILPGLVELNATLKILKTLVKYQCLKSQILLLYLRSINRSRVTGPKGEAV